MDRLPAFDGQARGAGNERQFLQRVAAIGDFRRQGVVLAVVAEGFVVEGLEDDIDLLLKQFAVGFLIQQGRAEGFHFAGMVAAADAEDDPAVDRISAMA